MHSSSSREFTVDNENQQYYGSERFDDISLQCQNQASPPTQVHGGIAWSTSYVSGCWDYLWHSGLLWRVYMLLTISLKALTGGTNHPEKCKWVWESVDPLTLRWWLCFDFDPWGEGVILKKPGIESELIIFHSCTMECVVTAGWSFIIELMESIVMVCIVAVHNGQVSWKLRQGYAVVWTGYLELKQIQCFCLVLV